MWHAQGKKDAYRVLVGKAKQQRPLARARGKQKYNIKMHLQEMRWQGSNWLDLAHGRVKWWSLLNAVNR